jgi:hypothetical protein
MTERPLSASVSATVLDALGPMIREVQDFAGSDMAFMSQWDPRKVGTYLIPQEKGTLVLVLDYCRLLVLRDTEGMATEPIKLYLPDDLLAAAAIKHVRMVGEGDSFEVEVQPRPGRLVVAGDLAMLTPHCPEEWQKTAFDGLLGTWHNQDHGIVIMADSFRAERVDLAFIGAILRKAYALPSMPTTWVSVDLTRLAAFAHAAKRLNQAFVVGFHADDKHPQPIMTFHSSPGADLFGLLMPLEDRAIPEQHVADALLAAIPNPAAEAKV